MGEGGGGREGGGEGAVVCLVSANLVTQFLLFFVVVAKNGIGSIENHPDHLPSMLLLGSIGVLDENEDILEAVMDDLYSVRANEVGMNLKDKVDGLLTVVSGLRVTLPSDYPHTYFLLTHHHREQIPQR